MGYCLRHCYCLIFHAVHINFLQLVEPNALCPANEELKFCCQRKVKLLFLKKFRHSLKCRLTS